MVLEEERRREGIESMILEMVTGPPEQVAPCIRNALEVRLGLGLAAFVFYTYPLPTHVSFASAFPLSHVLVLAASFIFSSPTPKPAFPLTPAPLSPPLPHQKHSVAGNKPSQGAWSSSNNAARKRLNGSAVGTTPNS